MAYFSKDVYERKDAWAKKRMLENAENENLTEEQHDVLAWLCSKRHEVHCNQKAFFNDQHAAYREYWHLITDWCGGLGTIREKLLSVGLPDLTWNFFPEDYTTNTECYELGYSDEEYLEAEEQCYGMANQFNNDIESYLRLIDKQYGTDYCPSGIGRLEYSLDSVILRAKAKTVGKTKNDSTHEQNR